MAFIELHTIIKSYLEFKLKSHTSEGIRVIVNFYSLNEIEMLGQFTITPETLSKFISQCRNFAIAPLKSDGAEILILKNDNNIGEITMSFTKEIILHKKRSKTTIVETQHSSEKILSSLLSYFLDELSVELSTLQSPIEKRLELNVSA